MDVRIKVLIAIVAFIILVLVVVAALKLFLMLNSADTSVAVENTLTRNVSIYFCDRPVLRGKTLLVVKEMELRKRKDLKQFEKNVINLLMKGGALFLFLMPRNNKFMHPFVLPFLLEHPLLKTILPPIANFPHLCDLSECDFSRVVDFTMHYNRIFIPRKGNNRGFDCFLFSRYMHPIIQITRMLIEKHTKLLLQDVWRVYRILPPHERIKLCVIFIVPLFDDFSFYYRFTKKTNMIENFDTTWMNDLSREEIDDALHLKRKITVWMCEVDTRAAFLPPALRQILTDYRKRYEFPALYRYVKGVNVVGTEGVDDLKDRPDPDLEDEWAGQ